MDRLMRSEPFEVTMGTTYDERHALGVWWAMPRLDTDELQRYIDKFDGGDFIFPDE